MAFVQTKKAKQGRRWHSVYTTNPWIFWRPDASKREENRKGSVVKHKLDITNENRRQMFTLRARSFAHLTQKKKERKKKRKRKQRRKEWKSRCCCDWNRSAHFYWIVGCPRFGAFIVKSNDEMTTPRAKTRIDFFGFGRSFVVFPFSFDFIRKQKQNVLATISSPDSLVSFAYSRVYWTTNKD